MKKVRFNEKVDVYPIPYEQRKPYWELFILDRMRFQKRIQDAELILNPILDQKHRCKILMERLEIKD